MNMSVKITGGLLQKENQYSIGKINKSWGVNQMDEKTETMVHESSGISRRDFIAKTMLVGAGLAVSSFACATPQNSLDGQATSNNQRNESSPYRASIANSARWKSPRWGLAA